MERLRRSRRNTEEFEDSDITNNAAIITPYTAIIKPWAMATPRAREEKLYDNRRLTWEVGDTALERTRKSSPPSLPSRTPVGASSGILAVTFIGQASQGTQRGQRA